ncbi:MAG: hypothetical protein ACREP7_01205 [Lysobacter sp.]
MRRLHLATVLLLMSAGPAVAGNDFCDRTDAGCSAAIDSSQFPNGGGCEVDMMFHERYSPYPNASVRLHDFSFAGVHMRPFSPNTSLYLNAKVCKLEPDGHEILIEWSFVSQKTSNARRVLALTLSRIPSDAGAHSQVVLLARWFAPATAEWSLANPAASAEVPLLQFRRTLAAGENLSNFTLSFDGQTASINLSGETWVGFPLPTRDWVPAHFRNAIITDVPIPYGRGAELLWLDNILSE